MLSYRLGTVNDFLWEFKPVLSYSTPHKLFAFHFEERLPVIFLANKNECRVLRIKFPNSFYSERKTCITKTTKTF